MIIISLDDTNRFKDAKINELEEKCTNLAVELERLRNIINSKNSEIDNSRSIINQLEMKLNELKRLEAVC